jgi:signal transduction histidine kinase
MNNNERINLRLDVVNLIHAGDSDFVIPGEVPHWLNEFNPDITSGQTFSLPESLLFFDSYIEEVFDVLDKDPQAVISSGPWSEISRLGVEQNFSALAFRVDDQLIVQLKLIDDTRLYHQAVFQKAREYSMAFERLMKERERREVLLHTIVHDLAGPLTVIHGALELLERDPGRSQMVQLALKQCDVETDMIRSILDTFAAEFAPFDASTVNWENAPRLQDVIKEQFESFNAPFQSQHISLEVADQTGGADIRVMAELELLGRVISNLLQNALRFSPRDSTTKIELTRQDEHVTVSVIDEGEGVPEVLKPNLFERFNGGQRFGGKIGLGLYFCRITLARWGETIRCDPLRENPGQGELPGTRMSFTLTMLPDPAEPC